MSEQVGCPISIETVPVNVLILRIQSNPSVVESFPEPWSPDSPSGWERRLRFVLEATISGELDKLGLVESMPELDGSEISSFADLREATSEVYQPELATKLTEIHRRRTWLPVFEKLLQTNGVNPRLLARAPFISEKLCQETFADQAASAVGQVRLLSTMLTKHDVDDPDRIADHIKTGGLKITRHQANLHLEAAETMIQDIHDGDPRGLITFSDENGLALSRPIEACPVGTGPETKTVGAIMEEQDRKGHPAIGCPALKGSMLISKLMVRAVDDALKFGLFGESQAQIPRHEAAA
jgi:hypothetical protein